MNELCRNCHECHLIENGKKYHCDFLNIELTKDNLKDECAGYYPIETKTKGNIVIEDIKVGDIHYEYDYGTCIASEVIEEPKLNDKKVYHWKSKQLTNGEIIDYAQTSIPKYQAYGLNLYDYKAYGGVRYV